MIYEKGFGEIVDYWLEENIKLKRKNRRTNKKIEDLKEEHQFPVVHIFKSRKPQLREAKVKKV